MVSDSGLVHLDFLCFVIPDMGVYLFLLLLIEYLRLFLQKFLHIKMYLVCIHSGCPLSVPRAPGYTLFLLYLSLFLWPIE